MGMDALGSKLAFSEFLREILLLKLLKIWPTMLLLF